MQLTAGQPNLKTVAPATITIQLAEKPLPDWDRDVLEPLRLAQAEQAKKEAEAAEADRLAQEQAQAAEEARVIAERSVFRGSTGFSYAGGNCVDLAKAYGKNQPGNPISWSPYTNTPFIGAAALFYFNHVAVVTGIYPDGSVEVGQYNCPGCSTRFNPSQIRGYF